MAAGKTCPKCGYERQETDTAPTHECPKCGIIYAKAIGRPPQPTQKIPSAWQEEDIAKAPAAEPKNDIPDVNPSRAETAFKPQNLIDCEICGKLHSYQAKTCPDCGHPNPYAPRTAGLIAGVIAISLGVDAALMPYFAAVFIVPAAFAAAAVTGILRMRALALIALIPTCVGLYNIYETSKHLNEYRKSAEKAQGQLNYEIEQFKRTLER